MHWQVPTSMVKKENVFIVWLRSRCGDCVRCWCLSKTQWKYTPLIGKLNKKSESSFNSEEFSHAYLPVDN